MPDNLLDTLDERIKQSLQREKTASPEGSGEDAERPYSAPAPEPASAGGES